MLFQSLKWKFNFRWAGADNDYEGILNYITELFLEQDVKGTHKIHSFPTCATDTNNINIISANVQSIILDNIMEDVGLQP